VQGSNEGKDVERVERILAEATSAVALKDHRKLEKSDFVARIADLGDMG